MTEYIKREDLMERVGRWQLNTRETIAEMIMSVPSADVVERKRGKWVGRSENDCYPVCSECGRTRLGSSLGYCQKYVPFCEHCGADMRGRKDERTD